MRKVLVLSARRRRDGTSIDLSSKLRKGFEKLFVFCKKKDIEFYRAAIDDYDNDKKIFKEAQFFDGKKWLLKYNVRPEVIYNRSFFHLKEDRMRIKREMIEKEFFFRNKLSFNELLSNKWLTYKKFKKLSPKTVLIEKEKDLIKIEQLNSRKVICKPVVGSKGNGVKIFDKDKIELLSFPFIVQEFIEMTKGIDGIVKGTHDLRVVMSNEKSIYSFIRTPQKGKFIASLDQGGSLLVVNLKELPKDVFNMIKVISDKLREYGHKFYAIDMMIDDDGRVWITELNSCPGLTLEKEELQKGKDMWNGLVDFLKC